MYHKLYNFCFPSQEIQDIHVEYQHLIDLVASDENELKVLEKKIADISGRTVTAREKARLLKAEIARLKTSMATEGSFFQSPDTMRGTCAIM